jgi:hypothetical protein
MRMEQAACRFLAAIPLALPLMLSVSPAAIAQSTSHVFPQVVDGVDTQGASWESLLYATNFSGKDSSCTVSMYRLGDNGQAVVVSFPLRSGSSGYLLESSKNPVSSGYARLDCAQPVTAALIYRLISNDGITTSGMATVFSSPPTNDVIFLALSSELRTGIALANDNDAPIDVTVQFTDVSQKVIKRIIHIQARSQYVGFVDEMLGVASIGQGTVEIFTTQSGPQFSATGLVFAGNVFSTLVPSFYASGTNLPH